MQISEEKIKRFLNILMFQIHLTAVCTFCHWLFSWQTWWNASENDRIEGIQTEFETSHDKTNKMTVRPAKTQINLGIRPVWSESSLCAQWVAPDPSFLHADSEDSAQTGRMPRLIWVFDGRTCHFVGFVVRRLNFIVAAGISSDCCKC